MALLLAIGFVAGVVTAISPCVFPVLPIALAGGATGGRRRPYAVIAGLVTTFAAATLFAAWLLDRLGLPKDVLRDVAIALLFLVAATLLVPRLGELLSRALALLGRRPSGDLGGGFLLGASMGLVFVPCAGPVLAAISVGAATVDFGWRTIALTLAYAAGAAVPLLAVALGGQRALARSRLVSRHGTAVRAALGTTIALAALAIVFNLDTRAQTAIGDYTSALQKLERSDAARRELAKVTGGGRGPSRAASTQKTARLPDYGPAPDFVGITRWLNRRGGAPLSLAGLRGKVVLLDFWTYSCVNCLRTLPHVKAWDRAYRKSGLVIVGVHAPEFAFEHEIDNVERAIARLGVRYPVAIDNDFATWRAYSNQYWPAKYLIDARGHLRYAHFGEGEYEHTEALIRRLLAERGARLAGPVRLPDETPKPPLTPETYLGWERLLHLSGSVVRPGVEATYAFPPRLTRNGLAYAGRWRVEAERIVARGDARLRLRFLARNVFLVLGGEGRVDVLVDGRRVRTVRVTGLPRLYTLLRRPSLQPGLLELRFTRGVEAYAFTFG